MTKKEMIAAVEECLDIAENAKPMVSTQEQIASKLAKVLASLVREEQMVSYPKQFEDTEVLDL